MASHSEKLQEIEIYLKRLLQKEYATPQQYSAAIKELVMILDEKNETLKGKVYSILDDIPIQFIQELCESFLAVDENVDPDSTYYAIERFGEEQVDTVVDLFDPYLSDINHGFFSHACESLAEMDSKKALAKLEKLFDIEKYNEEHNAFILDLIINMKPFKNWKMLKAIIDANTYFELSYVALNKLIKTKPKLAKKLLYSLLQDQENEVIKQKLIKLCSFNVTFEIVQLLFTTANSNQNPKIKKHASWEIDKIPTQILQKFIPKLFKTVSEEEIPFYLTKCAYLKVENIDTYCLKYLESPNESIQLAALEALGELGNNKYIEYTLKYVMSDNPMFSYIATLSSVQLIENLEKCPELLKLLQYQGNEKDILKQVVLQYLAESVTWIVEDESLIHLFINNLKNENLNIRLMSLELLKQGEVLKAIPGILEVVFFDPDNHVKEQAVLALNPILRGDLSKIFKLNIPSTIDDNKLFSIIPKLSFSKESATLCLERLKTTNITEEIPEILVQEISNMIFRQIPNNVIESLDKEKLSPKLKFCFVSSWFYYLKRLSKAEQIKVLDTYIMDVDERITKMAVENALILKQDWILPILIRRFVKDNNKDLKQKLKEAIQTYMETYYGAS